MKISEFSLIYKVSERHVRRLIKKYESDLVGHCVREGNEGTFIDDEGVEFIKSKLKAQFEVVESGPSEDEKKLNEQLMLALAKCATLAEQLADAEKRAGQNAAAEALLEAAKMNVAQLEAQTDRAEERARAAEERARAAEEISEAATQAEERARADVEDLRAQLDAIAAARGSKRRKLLKEYKQGGKHGKNI